MGKRKNIVKWCQVKWKKCLPYLWEIKILTRGKMAVLSLSDKWHHHTPNQLGNCGCEMIPQGELWCPLTGQEQQLKNMQRLASSVSGEAYLPSTFLAAKERGLVEKNWQKHWLFFTPDLFLSDCESVFSLSAAENEDKYELTDKHKIGKGYKISYNNNS